jgi:hypothetical protein
MHNLVSQWRDRRVSLRSFMSGVKRSAIWEGLSQAPCDDDPRLSLLREHDMTRPAEVARMKCASVFITFTWR